MASTSSSWPESTTTGTLGACSMRRRKVSAPWLSGRFRSNNTSVGVSRVREARPSDKRFTQFTFTSDLAFDQPQADQVRISRIVFNQQHVRGLVVHSLVTHILVTHVLVILIRLVAAGLRIRTRILRSTSPPQKNQSDFPAC